MIAPKTIAAFSLALACSAMTLHADDAPPASQPAAIDYHKIKDAMPDTMAGLKRTHLEGSKMGFGGVQMSTAKADYGSDDDGALSAHVEVISYNNAEMAKGLAAWSQMEIDNEGDDGFQKTVKIQDQPAMLDYKSKDKSGTITVMAGGIMVTTTVKNCSPDQFKNVQDALPVKAIAALTK